MTRDFRTGIILPAIDVFFPFFFFSVLKEFDGCTGGDKRCRESVMTFVFQRLWARQAGELWCLRKEGRLPGGEEH